MNRRIACSAWAFGVAALLGGCERIPDYCADYALSCIGVTVESGPERLFHLRVSAFDGTYTRLKLIPDDPPAGGLVYPLRFGIRFPEFDKILYRGMVTLELLGYNEEFDEIGNYGSSFLLKNGEKLTLDVALEPLAATPSRP